MNKIISFFTGLTGNIVVYAFLISVGILIAELIFSRISGSVYDKKHYSSKN